jgi:hypothetical protein
MSAILKNKGSLTRESTVSLLHIKKRGRPKGAKNKPKLPPVAVVDKVLVEFKKPGRGRPKGAKNKPKLPVQAFSIAAPLIIAADKPKRGRPKGALNKPKVSQPAVVSPSIKKRGRPRKEPPVQEVQVKTPQSVVTTELEAHPVLLAAKWIEKHMHPTEVDYYRRRASRNAVSLHSAMVSDILGFFNVQNAEICKQIKKNNFITLTSNGLLS